MSTLSSLPYSALQHMYTSPEQFHAAFAAQQQLLAQQQQAQQSSAIRGNIQPDEMMEENSGDGLTSLSNKTQRISKSLDVRNRANNSSASSPQMLSTLMQQVRLIYPILNMHLPPPSFLHCWSVFVSFILYIHSFIVCV